MLADSTFHASEFELVSGMTSVKWERIPAQSNVSHVIVVRPLQSSAFNFTSAVVQYVAAEGAEPTVSISQIIKLPQHIISITLCAIMISYCFNIFSD